MTKRSTTRPTLRGVLFLAAGVGCGVTAYSTGRSELLYPAAFLVLLPVVAIVIVLGRPLRLAVTRTFSPAVIPAGASTIVELAIRNDSGWSSPAATWSDRVPWFPHVAGPGELPSLPASGTARGLNADGGVRVSDASRLGYSLRPSRRGVYDIGPLEVTYSDPFGLAVGRLRAGGSQPLYVTPVAAPLGESVSVVVSGEGSARLVQRMVTGNNDDLMTREYRVGDALRRVHWRASARHGELMVRQEEQRTYPEARIVLDTMADGYGSSLEVPERGDDWFEWVVTMTASIGVHLHRSGYHVEILESGPRQLAPLGDVSQGGRQDIPFLLSLSAVHVTDGGGRPGDTHSSQELDALGPVFAILADPNPETLGWIAGQRRPYERGIAFVIDTGNRASIQTLRASGWTCVSVSERSDPGLAWAAAAQSSDIQTSEAGR